MNGNEQQVFLEEAADELLNFVQEETDLEQSIADAIQTVYPSLYERQLLEGLAEEVLSSYAPQEELIQMSVLNLFEILYWLNSKKVFDIILTAAIIDRFLENHLLSLTHRLVKKPKEGLFLFCLKLLQVAKEKKMPHLQETIQKELPSLQKGLLFAEHKEAILWFLSKGQSEETKKLFQQMETLKRKSKLWQTSPIEADNLLTEMKELISKWREFSQKEQTILYRIKTKNFQQMEKLFPDEKFIPKPLQDRFKNLFSLFKKVRGIYDAHKKEWYYHLANDPDLTLDEEENGLLSSDQQKEIAAIKETAAKKIEEVLEIAALNKNFSSHYYLDLEKLKARVDALGSRLPDPKDPPEEYKELSEKQSQLLSKISTRLDPIKKQKDFFLAQLDKPDFSKALSSLTLLL